MTTRRTVSAVDPAVTQPALRRCIGSATFGIETHEARVEDFPVQPSQRDGLGRLCRVHWNQYTRGLRKAALARKAAEAPAAPTPEVAGDLPAASSNKRRAPKPEAVKTRKAKSPIEAIPDPAPAAEDAKEASPE